MSGNFPTLTKWTEKAAPDTYINKAPTVAAAANSLNVTIPADVTGDSWKYMVTVNGTEISGTGTGASFAIENLPAGGAYKLIVQSADGKRQMNPVYGTVAADEQGRKRRTFCIAADARRKSKWNHPADLAVYGRLHHPCGTLDKWVRRYCTVCGKICQGGSWQNR